MAAPVLAPAFAPKLVCASHITDLDDHLPIKNSDDGSFLDIQKELRESWAAVHLALSQHQAKQERLLARIVPGQVAGSRTPPSHEHEQSPQESADASCSVGPEANLQPESAKLGRPSHVTKMIAERTSMECDIDDLLDDLDAEQVARKEAPITYMCQSARRAVLRGLQWCFSLQEPPRVGPLASLLSCGPWNMFVNLMVVMNSVYVWYSVDFSASHLQSGSKPPQYMELIDTAFFAFFAIELLLRMAVHRSFFFCNDDFRWNIFETTLVLFSVYDFVLTIMTIDGEQNANVFFLRTLRILRVVRTLRVLRVLRFTAQLRRMLTSVLGSFSSLMWAFVMLAFVFGISGIAIVQTLTSSLMAEDSHDVNDPVRVQLLVHFGSVSDAMLTYYMATSGGNDWSMYFDLLLEKSPFGAFLFVLVIAFTQFALMNILTGIFVESAMKIAQPDRHARVLEMRRDEFKQIQEFRRCLEELDFDASGSISLQELKSLSSNPRMHALFSSIGLDVKDAELFFAMVCRDNNVNKEEVKLDFLIDACMNMRGPATSVDIQCLMYRMQMIQDRMNHIDRKQRMLILDRHLQPQGEREFKGPSDIDMYYDYVYSNHGEGFAI